MTLLHLRDIDVANWYTGSYPTVKASSTFSCEADFAGDDETTLTIRNAGGTSVTWTTDQAVTKVNSTATVIGTDLEGGGVAAGVQSMHVAFTAAIAAGTLDMTVTPTTYTNETEITLTQNVVGVGGNTTTLIPPNMVANGATGAASVGAVSNFSGGLGQWASPGANASGGYLDSTGSVDYYVSGNIDGSVSGYNFECKQSFVNGDEDLKIDVTKLVSASLAEQFTNNGFRLSFTGSEEDDTRTRFVKRFGSSQARNVFLRPLLRVGFDDSIRDHHKSFFFDLSGSIFLDSFERGKPANIKSGSALTPVTGSTVSAFCLHTKLVSGSFSKIVSASQHKIAGDLNNFITGVYSSSFALFSGDTSAISGSTTIADFVRDSGSITFDTYWQDLGNLVTWHTGSLKVSAPVRFGFNEIPKSLGVKITNVPPELGTSETVKFRVFVTDYNAQPKAKRIPYRLASTVVEKAYYRVRDVQTDKIMILSRRAITQLVCRRTVKACISSSTRRRCSRVGHTLSTSRS